MIKSAGVRFNEDYDSLAEKIVDYFELVTELEGKKLYLTVNLRSYVSDNEVQKFLDTVIQHGYNHDREFGTYTVKWRKSLHR